MAELKARGVRVVSNAGCDLSAGDKALLKRLSLVESVFAALKGQYNLVSSYCRSRAGYLLHYLRVLFSYQINKVLA